MKVTITDINVLSSVKVERIHKYLSKHGWHQQIEEEETYFSVWTKFDSNANTCEVVVPKSNNFRDYPERIAELLADIEHAEDKSQLFILREFNHIYRIRSFFLLVPVVILVIIFLQRSFLGNDASVTEYYLELLVTTQYLLLVYSIDHYEEWFEGRLHRKKQK